MRFISHLCTSRPGRGSLSILFVRFSRFCRTRLARNWSFNSLCEIQQAEGRDDGHYASFQFSLWDSDEYDIDLSLVRLYFQFSLWDSKETANSPAVKESNFQFSLWDSGHLWRERDGHFHLSILFVRFQGKGGLVWTPTCLSILFVRFISAAVSFLSSTKAFNSLCEILIRVGTRVYMRVPFLSILFVRFCWRWGSLKR